MKRWTSTEEQMTAAAVRVTGQKYCTHCQCFRKAEGGVLLRVGNGRTRWVCASCKRRSEEARNGGSRP